MMSENMDIIQYVPFTSFVHPGFWHTLSEIKLEIDMLEESKKQIHGIFTYRSDIGSIFEVDGASFNKLPRTCPSSVNVSGTIINKNTIEEFKNLDKTELLTSYGQRIWENVKNKNWIAHPNTLLSFLILSYSDLKKFSYYYWFAFPSPSQPTVHVAQIGTPLNQTFNENQIKTFAEGFRNIEQNENTFFAVKFTDEELTVKRMSEILDASQNNQTLETKGVMFCFCDASSGQNPGWSLRVFVAAIVDHCPNLAGEELSFISVRTAVNGDLGGSLLFKIGIPKDVKQADTSGWVGWERNDRGNFGPKLANMSASMDPVKLADSSADLNLKLMKWRLVPNLDLDIMKKSKCLLLGAGTLGCHVARDLLAWGFRHITFVDNGRVSYSNPARQVLYTHKDCLNGGAMKAKAAADNLINILPSASARGIVAHIPMPGHPIGESLKEESLKNIETITKAIQEHDIIFLLLDTREARWLPTLIAALHEKIVINAALGFDSYLVMRHGTSSESRQASSSVDCINDSYISGKKLGCYFCNDVTAPGNSLKDRTLDQQCTVTRPGVAAIAGALAVELTVALLQHRQGVNAPAAYNLTKQLDNELNPELEGILGPIPHSIRGFLCSYSQVLPTCMKFSQCIACSDSVIDKYRNEGTEFLMKVFDNAKYLEEVTGLTEMHLAAELVDVMTFSDEDSESSN